MLRKAKNWQNPLEQGGSLHHLRDHYTKGEEALIIRISKYGTSGMVKVSSSEGAPVSIEAAQNLVPAGMHHVSYLANIIQPKDNPDLD